ncbi:MAG TPA: glucosamine-6-phosphate deaminase [Nitrospira sp.]|nr:glucosamine-6-phosphate deaminase [Nitrospira sp.]
MLVVITETSEEGSRAAARLVSRAITNKPDLRLGLAAGRTPEGLYRSLVDLHRSAQLDCSAVRFFSLDELLGLPSDSPHRYTRFFHHDLLDQLGVSPAHVRLLTEERGHSESACAAYEQFIQEQGGIDLQLLGIGRNGHLGFNEPGSSLASRTRIVLLSPETREVLAEELNAAQVPQWAVTMGLGTIREARILLLMAFGDTKADAVSRAVEGPLTAEVPASSIHLHPQVVVVLDREAAGRLKHREYYAEQAAHLPRLLPAWLR